MNFVRNATWAQLSIPIPESSQWVKDEVEVHRLKRKFLKEKNWSFCGVYNSELKEELPSNWEGKMIKFLPNWRSMRLPAVAAGHQIQMPVQEKPWVQSMEMGEGFEVVPIKVPM